MEGILVHSDRFLDLDCLVNGKTSDAWIWLEKKGEMEELVRKRKLLEDDLKYIFFDGIYWLQDGR